MSNLTPPNTGSETLNEYLRQLQRVVDVLDLRKIPEEGWSLTDLKADVSEVISDKRDIIDVANEAASKLAEVKALVMDLDGYDQSLEEAKAFKQAAESLIDWYDQNEIKIKALLEIAAEWGGGAGGLVEFFSETLRQVKADLSEIISAKEEALDAAAASVAAAEIFLGIHGSERGVFTPEAYGAKGDGSTDDIQAVESAMRAAMNFPGGTVSLSASYAVSRAVGSGIAKVSGIKILGVGDVTAGFISLNNTPAISGSWQHSTIENAILDAGLKGSPALSAQVDKFTLRSCFIRGWTGKGLELCPSGDEVGLLNRICDNHIVQGTGIGIWTSYRFVDSWITGNNVGSTEANISVEAGPLRILGNHLNGTPEVNIELRGNQRITISDNILEGARKEAIRYTMPPWLESDIPQIQITGNALSNGGKGGPGNFPAIGIYGISPTKKVSGFSIVGNIIACQDEGSGWNYAVLAKDASDVVAVGNQWRLGYTVAATSGTVSTGNVG